MKVFLDSSALAKRYIAERGSVRVLELCRAADRVVLSQITPVEILSAAARLRRSGLLPPRTYRAVKQELAADLAEAELIEITTSIVMHAVRALERAPLRSLDAIQLACALAADCDLFVSSDTRQLTAARVLGLKVERVPG